MSPSVCLPGLPSHTIQSNAGDLLRVQPAGEAGWLGWGGGEAGGLGWVVRLGGEAGG